MSMKHKTKRKITNFFGGFGYFLCAMQWLFIILIYSSYIKDLAKFVSPNIATPPLVKHVNATVDLSSNPLLLIVATFITVIFVALSIYLFIKTPKAIVTTTKKVVHDTAEVVAPVLMRVQHVQETPQRHKIFVLRVTVGIKIFLITMPLILSFCSYYASVRTLDLSVVIFLGVWLAASTTIFFLLQYVLAHMLRIDKQEIW